MTDIVALKNCIEKVGYSMVFIAGKNRDTA